MKRKIPNQYSFFLYFVLILTSCVPIKDVTYVQNISGDEHSNEYLNERRIRIVEIRDELYIKIISTDEQTARILSNESTDNRYSVNLSLITYTVDNKGYIDFPFIGKIKVQGLTLEETKKLLEKNLSDYISNLSVVVKFVDNKVTVLGEVNHAGEYNYTQDHITIFEALGLAGGVTQFGSIKNITLIRTNDTKISYYNLNLTDKKIAESPFFYLNPKDVIIVNPIRYKFWTMKSSAISIALASITTLVSVLYFFNAK